MFSAESTPGACDICINPSSETVYVPAEVIKELNVSPVSFINGSYNNTILIRPIDDSFVPFDTTFMETQADLLHLSSSVGKLCTEIVQPNDVDRFLHLLKNFIQKRYNIIIDARLEKFISIATLCLHDEVLIFDPFSLKISNIFSYTSNICKISPYEMTLFRIIMLHTAKLVLGFLRNVNIIFDAKEIYNIIIEVESRSTAVPELWIISNYLRMKHNMFRNDAERDEIKKHPMQIVSEYYIESIINMNVEVLSMDTWNMEGISYSNLMNAFGALMNGMVSTVF